MAVAISSNRQDTAEKMRILTLELFHAVANCTMYRVHGGMKNIPLSRVQNHVMCLFHY